MKSVSEMTPARQALEAALGQVIHSALDAEMRGLETRFYLKVPVGELASRVADYAEAVSSQRAKSERVAEITAHRACGSEEHDPANGKLHGYCVVCLVPFPCSFVSQRGAPRPYTMEDVTRITHLLAVIAGLDIEAESEDDVALCGAGDFLLDLASRLSKSLPKEAE